MTTRQALRLALVEFLIYTVVIYGGAMLVALYVES